MREPVCGGENGLPHGAREADSCTWNNSRRDQPSGPSTRFDSFCGRDPEGILRQGKGREQSLPIQAPASDAAVRAMFQNGPHRAPIGAKSVASRKISRLGEALQQRLHLPEVCTTNGSVVHFELGRNFPPRIAEPASVSNRLPKWRQARTQFGGIDPLLRLRLTSIYSFESKERPIREFVTSPSSELLCAPPESGLYAAGQLVLG